MRNIILILLFPLITVGCSRQSHADEASGEVTEMAWDINEITITEPQKALAMLDSIEHKGSMSPFEINYLRCLAYHNGLSDYKRALRYALQAYRMPEGKKFSDTYQNLTEMIADEYFEIGNYAESMRYCSEGIERAIALDDKNSEANLHVTFAQNMMCMTRPEEAFHHLRTATKTLRTEAKRAGDDARRWDNYIYALGITISAYSDEKRYDEAVALAPAYDAAMKGLEACKDIQDGLVDMRMASGYAQYAYIYRLQGNTAEAARQYDLLIKTRYANTLDGEAIRVPYLLADGQYKDALHYIDREKTYWKANADTVSFAYIDAHLKNELKAYEGLGNLAAANRIQHTIQVLTDTLRRRERADDAIELAEIYKTNEQALLIEQHKASIHLRNIALVCGLIAFVLVTLFTMRIVRHNRKVRSKNKSMAHTIDELMKYKDELYVRQNDIVRLNKEIEALRAESREIEAGQDVSRVEKDNPAPERDDQRKEKDRALFDRMSHEIISRSLFLESDFSRDSLLREFKIPVNRFSALFRDYAGCSFSQFVQDCRLDHAVRLMREHPEWSYEAIASESRMSNSSFYSQFQRKYGMKPSEFRQSDDF